MYFLGGANGAAAWWSWPPTTAHCQRNKTKSCVFYHQSKLVNFYKSFAVGFRTKILRLASEKEIGSRRSEFLPKRFVSLLKSPANSGTKGFFSCYKKRRLAPSKDGADEEDFLGVNEKEATSRQEHW